MAGYRRILIATDFSPVSEAALEEAARLARESGATLCVLHVYENPAVVAVPYVPAESYLESLVAARTQAESRMRRLLSRGALRDLPVRAVVAKGLPGTQIVETAIRERSDLIVMGTRGMSAISNLVMGSVATKVIHLTKLPVTLVK